MNMTTIDTLASGEPLNDAASGSTASVYAGFWRRTLALLIDWCIVWSIVSVFFISLVVAVPGTGRVVSLSAPLGIGTSERTIDKNTYETAEADGGKTIRSEKTVEHTFLNRWVYQFR